MTGETKPIQVLGIAGSLRAGSYNRALLRAAVASICLTLIFSACQMLQFYPKRRLRQTKRKKK